MTTLETLLQLLPEGWEEACFTCGAIKRKRKIRNSRDWMQLCFIYFMEKCSMIPLSTMTDILEIANLSDVVLPSWNVWEAARNGLFTLCIRYFYIGNCTGKYYRWENRRIYAKLFPKAK